ncbi:alpha/beta fold hydrolase [Amycolatopsis jejuensis]|uniref:alpha/beta fold hydrolase n=1 Tax=Amycolatopsis jejuensis TaxID=330084 RepID=UPI0007C4F3FB|nr:alpha/beta hydrolase [Amycolatopsis jejuensis]
MAIVGTTRHRIEHGAEQLFVQEAGPAQATGTVVFCHGAAGSHASWFQQVPHFARRYRVLAWDQRGFGNSTNRTASASPGTAVADLAHLLEVLDVRRAHLVGQSLGGWAALGCALQYPDRVASVVLSNSIGGLFNRALEDAFDRFLAQRNDTTTHLGKHPALAPTFAGENPAQAFLYQQLAGLGPRPPSDAVTQIRETYLDLDEVARANLPILLLLGEFDQIFPVPAVQAVAAELPRARVEVIREAGHSAYFERPAEFNAALERFLVSCP